MSEFTIRKSGSVPDNMHKPIENRSIPISPTDIIPISHILNLGSSPSWPIVSVSPSPYAYTDIITNSPTLR